MNSYEIPVPDDYVFHFGTGKKQADPQRREKQIRRRIQALQQAHDLQRLNREAQLQRAIELRQHSKTSRDRLPKGFSETWVNEQRDRQSLHCFWCSEVLVDKQIHLDHVWPLSLGGFHDVANLVIACVSCNLEKGSKSPWEYIDILVKHANEGDQDHRKTDDQPVSVSFVLQSNEQNLSASQLKETMYARLSEMGIESSPEASRQSPTRVRDDQLELTFETGGCYSIAVEVEGEPVLTLFNID